MEKFVIYCRVSTKEQGLSGLGLDAQLDTCRNYIAHKQGETIGEFFDIKSGSSRNRNGLNKALSTAREKDATIVFSKLDRLARDSEYAHAIRNSGVKLYFCDFPELNTLLFGILVSFAQYEKEKGQERTKDALRSITREIELTGSHTSEKSGNTITGLGRTKGTKAKADWAKPSEYLISSFRDKIGSDTDRRRQWLSIQQMRSKGETMAKIADTMNAIGELTPRGYKWSSGSVCAVLEKWGDYFLEAKQIDVELPKYTSASQCT